MLLPRRTFLGSSAALAAATTAPGARPLPLVKFGDAEVTKLIIGSNPFYGFSHFNRLLDACMREYYTQHRRIEILRRAESAGVNTWQVHYHKTALEDFHRYRAEGGKMNWLLLADFELMSNWKLLAEVAKLQPIGVAHHGNRTDDRFREGRMEVVHDFVKAVQDAGIRAGISTHNPAVVAHVEDRGWKNDYYMTCMYRVSRTAEEMREQFGESPLGEIYLEKDPERMCRMIRQTPKTCFAFKLLGAGRRISQPPQVAAAFRYVIDNIKPTDAVIVGMFPKFHDEVLENVELVHRICGGART